VASEILRPSAEAALEEWAARVRANREQVDRFREVPDAPDFYGSVAPMFQADPHRTDEPVLELLRELARPGETWLDIGAGAGRYALPLALRVGQVIALDASEGMLAALRSGMSEHGITNISTVHGRWPTAEPLEADVALICHVGYDIEQIGPFLAAMEASARRRCAAVLFERRPTTPYDALWPEVHGQPRATLPALREFLVLLLARGRVFEVGLVERPPMSYPAPEQALDFARRQTWVQPGGPKDVRLQRLVAERLTERDGRYAFDWSPGRVALVSWSPETVAD
jgi:SAM-dependent methyltransferase